MLPLLWSCANKQRPNIRLVVLDHFDPAALDSIQYTLHNHFGIPVEIEERQSLPTSAFVHIKTPRYRADSLLKFLSTLSSNSNHYFLGLTDVDISTTKKDRYGNVKSPKTKYGDWGIFGLAYCPGRQAVVSSHRLDAINAALTLHRLRKVCVHEVGHNFGLKHCPNPNCVMQDAAESIATIDGVALKFCSSCRSKL